MPRTIPFGQSHPLEMAVSIHISNVKICSSLSERENTPSGSDSSSSRSMFDSLVLCQVVDVQLDNVGNGERTKELEGHLYKLCGRHCACDGLKGVELARD
jgi:hypothetical protein